MLPFLSVPFRFLPFHYSVPPFIALPSTTRHRTSANRPNNRIASRCRANTKPYPPSVITDHVRQATRFRNSTLLRRLAATYSHLRSASRSSQRTKRVWREQSVRFRRCRRPVCCQRHSHMIVQRCTYFVHQALLYDRRTTGQLPCSAANRRPTASFIGLSVIWIIVRPTLLPRCMT